MPPCSLPWYVFWWFCKDYKCTSVSFSEISKCQRAYLPLQDVRTKKNVCMLYWSCWAQWALWISAHHLYSKSSHLLHLRIHTVSVGFQHYQYAAHMPAGLQITLWHPTTAHSATPPYVDLYFIAIFMSNIQAPTQSFQSTRGCANFSPLAIKLNA